MRAAALGTTPKTTLSTGSFKGIILAIPQTISLLLPPVNSTLQQFYLQIYHTIKTSNVSTLFSHHFIIQTIFSKLFTPILGSLLPVSPVFVASQLFFSFLDPHFYNSIFLTISHSSPTGSFKPLPANRKHY